MIVLALASAVAVAVASAELAFEQRLDGDLVAYEPVGSLRGTLSATGSDTMLELQTLVAEAFRSLYPSVIVEVEGKGSATAPPALLEGTAQIAAMSRPMQASELDAFQQRYGYPPTRFDVARDTLVLWVNHDNPLRHLTLPQADAIFSRNRRCGLVHDIVTWSDLGLGSHWATAPISLYGRNAASGTHGYFQREVLCGGDFKSSVKEQLGSASVVQGIGRDLYGIGYSGGGYGTSGVRSLSLALHSGDRPLSPSDPDYPLSRYVHLYVHRSPERPLDVLTRELLRFVLSADGQRIVLASGFEPLDATTARHQLRRLEETSGRGPS